MEARDLKRLLVAIPLLTLCLGGAAGFALRPSDVRAAAGPEQVAEQALLSIREQGRLVPFASRFVAVVTSSESRFGLDARKTLIMPGAISYGLDLARLRRENLEYDERTQTLSVTLPPLEISVPDIDLNEVQEYKEGDLVLALTDAERSLDQTNRRSAQDDLMRQAKAARPIGLARNMAMRSVARSFALPLRAAGFDVSVAVRFVDPSGKEESYFLDRPRHIDEAVSDRQAG